MATHGKTAAAIDGHGSGDGGAAPLPGGAAGEQQGAPLQTPTQPFEARPGHIDGVGGVN